VINIDRICVKIEKENERILLRNTHKYTHKHTLQMRGKVPYIVPYIGFDGLGLGLGYMIG
jgi:hypothetical protein